jgi:transcriptional regulator with GAF, ATPase, and Fis domain
LDPAVSRHLADREYAGNVRELKHLIERIGRRHVGPGPITLGDLPADERTAAKTTAVQSDEDLLSAIRAALRDGSGLREISEAATHAAVDAALQEADGNVRRASERLGVTPRALQLRAARRSHRSPHNGGGSSAGADDRHTSPVSGMVG